MFNRLATNKNGLRWIPVSLKLLNFFYKFQTNCSYKPIFLFIPTIIFWPSFPVLNIRNNIGSLSFDRSAAMLRTRFSASTKSRYFGVLLCSNEELRGVMWYTGRPVLLCSYAQKQPKYWTQEHNHPRNIEHNRDRKIGQPLYTDMKFCKISGKMSVSQTP